MGTGRPSKAECLDGFSDAIGAVERLGPEAFPQRDVFEPSRRVTRSDADHVVDSRSGLLDALSDHAPGAVIWVDGTIDVGDAEGLELADVTLASGYGASDQATGTLWSDEKPKPLFHVHDDVRLTGLRLFGDEFEYFDPADRFPGVDKPIYEVGASSAVFVHGDGVELDNLLLSGWTYAGISVRRDGRRDVSTHIHHVDAVDNPAESLGYGVTVREGRPLVELSYFDNNRHSIAGTGRETCGYAVRFCVFGGYHTSHAIDMHGKHVDGYDLPIAGNRLEVYNNVVKLRRSYHDGRHRSAVKIRGRPTEGAEIVGNWFFNERSAVDNETSESAVRQLHAPKHAFRKMRVADNVYGIDRSAERVDLTAEPDLSLAEEPSGTAGRSLLGAVRSLL